MLCKLLCPLITFMPNKCDKYGIKFWIIVDVNLKYFSNIVPYLGAQEVDGRGGIPLAESVVMKLPYHVTRNGYNIACNEFFTSLTQAKKFGTQQ